MGAPLRPGDVARGLPGGFPAGDPFERHGTVDEPPLFRPLTRLARDGSVRGLPQRARGCVAWPGEAGSGRKALAVASTRATVAARTSREGRHHMSAQPEYAPSPVPAPAAAAQLLARIRADRRAPRWEPAFVRDWDKALGDSRASFDLTPLHEVVRAWQGRLDTASAVDRFIDEGLDDSDGVSLEAVIGARR